MPLPCLCRLEGGSSSGDKSDAVSEESYEENNFVHFFVGYGDVWMLGIGQQ
jgi:hypothetical protein